MAVQRARTWLRALARVSLGASLALALVAATPWLEADAGAQGDAQHSFDDLYRRGQEVNGAMKTLTARFSETTTSTLLTRPLIARGTVIVERPSRVLLRYEEPQARTILIDGDRMTLVWPDRDLRQTRDIGAAQARVQKYFVNSTPDGLRREFDIESRDASDRPGSYRITMVPRRRQVKEGLSALDLWIDHTSLLLSAMRMTFPNGDEKMMTFEDVVLNPPVDPSVFAAGR